LAELTNGRAYGTIQHRLSSVTVATTRNEILQEAQL